MNIDTISTSGINYDGVKSIKEQVEIDSKAHEKYYNSCFEDDSVENFGLFNEEKTPPLTYNSWYGTELHQKFVIPFLRKAKLEKLNKKAGY